jgi:hypothetical protein
MPGNFARHFIHLLNLTMKTFILPALLLLFFFNIAEAQKQAGYRVPQNLKIDGNAKEWGGQYQNYNRKNELRYSLANDDKNLYLVIAASDVITVDKIGRGGITFTISKLTEKKQRQKDTGSITIQYPFRDLNKDALNLGNLAREYKGYKEDDVTTNKASMDSIRTTANDRFADTYKLIKVTGVTAVADTFISIYNTHGIKAAAAFDNKLTYVYELAIPLKHLKLNTIDITKFSYNIKLNGPPTNEDFIRAGRFPMPVVVSISEPNSRAEFVYEFLHNPTDFWGEYMLTK